ncbi:MAG: hypothetical protein WD396_09770, partial [Pseudohongiellaceae bacterium]
MSRRVTILLAALLFALPAVPAAASGECVVLLHGLARVSNSMGELERKLGHSGYSVANISYPSTREPLDVLANDAVGRGLEACRQTGAEVIHFVTHSLGGILLRYYHQSQGIAELGRVVMLGPPNQGSELVDGLDGVPGFGILGPTGRALGTEPEDIPRQLGPVAFELGVIAGDVNLNPLSLFLIDGANDSVVSVESTRVEGM